MGKVLLSAQTERILSQARVEALKLGHSQVSTEHLLLALLVQQRSEAAELLQEHGWQADAIRRLLDKGTPGLPLPQGLTLSARLVLEAAAREAAGLQQTLVQPEHLLMALLRTEGSGAAELLQNNGTDLNCLFTDLYVTVRDGVIRPP